MNIEIELSRIAKTLKSSFRNGEYVVGIMGINGDRIFEVIGRERELGKPVTLLKSVVTNQKTDDYDFNLKPINKNNWKQVSKVLKPNDLEWAETMWG